jgi:UPF0271 protein
MSELGLRIDVNADVGEGRGAGPDGGDEPLLALVTTAHIACGGHAGDAASMGRAVRAARDAGVAVGAHPSYPDRAGFGRRELSRSCGEVVDDVVSQCAALRAVAGPLGVPVRSVKPHGALSARLAGDPAGAADVASAVRALDPRLRLVLPAGSAGLAAARATGAPVLAEGFCDRAYGPDGTLVARSVPGAVVTDPDEVARRAVELAVSRRVRAVDGTVVDLDCDTLCIHGDTPGAVALAAAVRAALQESGVLPSAPPWP